MLQYGIRYGQLPQGLTSYVLMSYVPLVNSLNGRHMGHENARERLPDALEQVRYVDEVNLVWFEEGHYDRNMCI